MVNSEIASDRYHRQEKLIPGWKQSEIQGTRAIVIGSGRLSDMLLADLLSMGVGSLTRLGYSDFFEFEKINPDVYVEQINEELTNYPLADVLIRDADIVIDATNNKQSKYYSAGAAQSKDITYLSISASNNGFSFFPLQNAGTEKSLSEKSLDDLVAHHDKDYFYKDTGQGIINSIVCSAIATDEIRKRIFSLENDLSMDRYTNSDIVESENSLEGKKILQVGAGAIGTFSALALSSMGVDLTVVDFDVVEETNLNRQFLFYDDIGKNKAEALAAKLGRYSLNVKSNKNKIGPIFHPDEYCSKPDALFSCVDNNETRFYMNRSSVLYGLPLVNGGSSLSAGAAMAYFHGKTACIDCQTGGKLREALNKEHAKRAPGECFQPSLIISNQVVGGLMVNAFIKGLSGNYERSDYVTGQGIFNQKIDEECAKECITTPKGCRLG